MAKIEKPIAKTEKRPLIEVLNELSLEDIRAEIGTHEEQIKHHQAQIDSLRVLEKAVDMRRAGKGAWYARDPMTCVDKAVEMV